MIHSATYLALREDALLALREKRLLDALAAVEGQLSYMGSWAFKQQLFDIKQAYSMLLTYLKQGAADPSRFQQRLMFLRQTYELSERIHREFTLQHSHQHRADIWRALGSEEAEHLLSEALRGGEQDYRVLFEAAWISPAWSKDELEAADAFMETEEIDDSLKATLISGVMLRLIASFDARQVEWLMSILRRDVSVALYDRALVALVFAVIAHEHFDGTAHVMLDEARERKHSPLDFYPDIREKLMLLSREERYRSRMLVLQKVLLSALEAPRYAKRMEEEIVPELLKHTADFPKINGADVEEIERVLRESPGLQAAQQALLDRLSDFLEMQQRGVDATFSSFRHVVRRLPFFNVAANWFCPFSLSHPEVAKTHVKRRSWENALKNKLCDTDRFALLKFIDMAGKASTEQEQTASHDFIDAQSTPAVSFEVVDEEGNPKAGEADELRAYIHDCYRFFKLFAYRNEQEDPFGRNIFLLDYDVFSSIFSDGKNLLDLAGFCFRLNHYERVEQLMRHIPDNALSLALQAYNYEMQEKEEEAVSAYEKLLLLNDDEKNVRRFADCLWKFKRYEDALIHLIRLEMEHPDEIDLLLRVGECFLLVELYADAVERFRKVIYLSQNHPQAVRQLAWCLMMQSDFAASMAEYDKLLSSAPADIDFFNAAHNSWLSGDVPTATALYREYLEKKKTDFAPKELFEDCKPYLLRLGLSEEDFPMMIDLLNCGL